MGKLCEQCGKEKPLDNFYVYSYGGVHKNCKECFKQNRRKLYKKRKEKPLDIEKARKNRREVIKQAKELLQRLVYKGDITYTQVARELGKSYTSIFNTKYGEGTAKKILKKYTANLDTL